MGAFEGGRKGGVAAARGERGDHDPFDAAKEIERAHASDELNRGTINDDQVKCECGQDDYNVLAQCCDGVPA